MPERHTNLVNAVSLNLWSQQDRRNVRRWSGLSICFLSAKSVIGLLWMNGQFVILGCAIKLVNCKISRTFCITVNTAPWYLQECFPKEATLRKYLNGLSHSLYYRKRNTFSYFVMLLIPTPAPLLPSTKPPLSPHGTRAQLMVCLDYLTFIAYRPADLDFSFQLYQAK